MARKKTEVVRGAINAAAPAEASGAADVNQTGPDWLRKRFKMLETGLHLVRDETLHWISSPFRIEVETRDENGFWGVLLSWSDRDGTPRSEIFGRELFAGDGRELRNRLAAGGLTLNADNRAKQAFSEYLNIAKAPGRARCVERTGWHLINERRIFVLPERVIGNTGDERVILQGSTRERAPFKSVGTLEGWQNTIGNFAIANTRLVFCISAAFAGSLLELVDEDGGGFNLKGSSRIGKSTTLRVAASVWGGRSEEGSAAFIRSWRATASGLESVATQYSDTLLALDELGQIDAAQIGDVAYMLANGSGKARADRNGGARLPARWRVLFISTGEIGLADKNAEAKKVTKAGQEIRIIDVDADAGAGFGLFEELHDYETADKFAEVLRIACRSNFGTAGVAFLEYLLGQLGRDPEFIGWMRKRVEALVADWLKGITNTGGQVRSVARRFALVAVAGEIATQGGVTGWNATEACDAAKVLFDAWLAERGTPGASEDKQAMQQLAAFISRHGASRFEMWGNPKGEPDGQQVEDDMPVERVRTIMRAGWRRYIKKENAFRYYVTDDGMNEALAGLNFKQSIRALVAAKMILSDTAGRTKTVCQPPGVGKSIRLYMLPGDVIGLDSEDRAD